jgi:hypothetical protein
MTEKNEGDVILILCMYCSWKKTRKGGVLSSARSHLWAKHRIEEPIDKTPVEEPMDTNKITPIIDESWIQKHIEENFLYCDELLPNYNIVWFVGPNGRWKRGTVETDQKWAYGHPVHFTLVPVDIFAIPNRPLTLSSVEASLETLNKMDFYYESLY